LERLSRELRATLRYPVSSQYQLRSKMANEAFKAFTTLLVTPPPPVASKQSVAALAAPSSDSKEREVKEKIATSTESKATGEDDSVPFTDTSAHGGRPFMAELLLRYFGRMSSTDTAAFLATLHDMFKGSSSSRYGPFTIPLSPTEQLYYDSIAKMCQAASDKSKETRQDLVRLWLGLGTVEHILQASLFLLTHCSNKDAADLELGKLLNTWHKQLQRYPIHLISSLLP
jgi:hypothetical protein